MWGIFYTFKVFILSTVAIFIVIMAITSVYAFLWWDINAWENVLIWLNPVNNLYIRILLMGLFCVSGFYGYWMGLIKE